LQDQVHRDIRKGSNRARAIYFRPLNRRIYKMVREPKTPLITIRKSHLRKNTVVRTFYSGSLTSKLKHIIIFIFVYYIPFQIPFLCLSVALHSPSQSFPFLSIAHPSFRPLTAHFPSLSNIHLPLNSFTVSLGSTLSFPGWVGVKNRASLDVS